MSNAARKARKRNFRDVAQLGEIANPSEFQFRKPPKQGTPREKRIANTPITYEAIARALNPINPHARLSMKEH